MTLRDAVNKLNELESEVIRLKNGHLPSLRAQIAELRVQFMAGSYAETVGDIKTVAGVIPLATLEKQAILRAVLLVPDRVKCASLLGIGKTTLYRKIEEYQREGILPREGSQA